MAAGNLSQQAVQSAEELARKQEEQARRLAQAQQAAEVQRQADMAAANTQMQTAVSTAQQNFQRRYDAGARDLYDMIGAGEREMAAQQQAAEEQRKRDLAAARWTGLGEVAASLVNLVGVGGHNAVNQQYRQYSQDWMRKADADLREHRARMQNLKERQRAMTMQLNQLRMNESQQALANARADAEAAYKRNIANADAAYKNNLAAAQLQAEGELNAAATRQKGYAQAADIALKQEQQRLQERGQNISAQQHRDSMAMQAARYGLKRNSDGSYSLDTTSLITTAALKAGAGSDGDGRKNTLYYYDTGGELVEVHMTTAEYNNFVEQSYATIKDNPDFKAAYRRAQTETERKSIIYEFACQNDKRRRVLSQYGYNPEAGMRTENAEKQVVSGAEGVAATDAWLNS